MIDIKAAAALERDVVEMDRRLSGSWDFGPRESQ